MLVATTVIEVGVDVPNATVMVIMDADRFGVSQLHQLRGRVGRGGLPGLCLLVTDMPEAARPPASALDAVAATLDGFELSRVDLEQRREGDVLGAAQSGRRSSLRLLPSSATRTSSSRGSRRPGLITTAREIDRLDGDPELLGHPGLMHGIEKIARNAGSWPSEPHLEGRPGLPKQKKPWTQPRGRPPPECRPRLGPPRVRCRGNRRAEGLTITPVGLQLGHLEGRRTHHARPSPRRGDHPCGLEADTCSTLDPCVGHAEQWPHDSGDRGERGWQAAGRAAGERDETHQ